MGVVVGFVAGLAFVAVFAFTRWGRGQHWRLLIRPLMVEPNDHSAISLKSRDWHTVINLRCTVTDPYGVSRASRPSDHTKDALVLLAPGGGATLAYPAAFDAPWPDPGTYRVTWESNVEGRGRPVVVGRMRWKVQ